MKTDLNPHAQSTAAAAHCQQLPACPRTGLGVGFCEDPESFDRAK
jgi:hypothetical protein